MTSAIENAYLLLLAQIALITSTVLFSVPKIIYHHDDSFEIGKNEWLFLVAISIISIMMIANLIIGWASLRDILKNDLPYNLQMFMLDLVIVVVLFSMNNVLMFSFKGEISLQSNDIVVDTLVARVPLKNSSIMIGFISLLTGLFLYLCKRWNYHYYKLKEIEQSKKYETKLSIVIGFVLFLSAIGFILNHIYWLQIVVLSSLIVSWVYINYEWLRDKFKTK